MPTRRASIIGGVGSPSSGATTNIRIARQTGTSYPSSITRTADQKAGDRISVYDFGAVGDGVTDDAAAFNAAIAAAQTVGHGVTIYAPSAQYFIGAAGIVFPSSSVPIILEGDGGGTVLLRGGSMTTQGVIDIQGCSDITLYNFTIDGQVTTPVGVLYSSLGSPADPMNSTLTNNTSIWIHSGSARIRLQGLKITHSGGYAVLVDCRTSTVQDIRILDSTFINNRPHLFGTSALDLNYGSWTGGVFVEGDGTTSGAGKVLRDFLVANCTWTRCTGNCLWSHIRTALNDLHTNFRWTGNHFEDIGLDGMGVNGVSGGCIDGNTVHRNGYICTDDTSASTPKYLSNFYSVGLDTAGLVKGVAYKGNSFTSPNGAAMDLDGYSNGVVSGNVARVPISTDPEYTVDQIATTGPGGTGNVSYGAQVSNTNNDPIAGTNVHVVGNTFLNLSGGAVRMYASRNGVVSGNTINHPAAPTIQPIVLGNIGTGANQRAYNNVVTGNQISYSPGTAAPCVFEDSSIAAFSASDVNWVYDNQIVGNGNAFEFQKDSVTASITQAVHSSQAHVTSASETIVQRQGTGTGSLTRWYGNEAGTKHLLLDLHHGLFNSTPSLVGGPLLNVSTDGGAGSGSVSTGGRTTLAFDDCLATSRGVMDGFLALTDSTFTYPNDASANLLPATYALIRYHSASGILEQSTTVSGGNRVWAPLGSAGAAGSTNQVQYNAGSGVFGASTNFTFVPGSQLLTVTAINSSSAGIACATGYIQSDAGFYATTGTATSFQSIQAPGGGVYAKSLRAINYSQIGNSSVTPTVTTGDTFVAGALYFDTTAVALKVYNGSAWSTVGGSGVTSLNSLTGALSIVGTTNQITVTPSGSNITLSTPQNIDTSASVNFATVTLPNNSSYNCKDTGGTAYSVLLMGSDNNVYLDNDKTSQDIYIRPAVGRFVFLGRGSSEFICPDGDGTAGLGSSSYGWGDSYFHGICKKYDNSLTAGQGLSPINWIASYQLYSATSTYFVSLPAGTYIFGGYASMFSAGTGGTIYVGIGYSDGHFTTALASAVGVSATSSSTGGGGTLVFQTDGTGVNPTVSFVSTTGSPTVNASMFIMRIN